VRLQTVDEIVQPATSSVKIVLATLKGMPVLARNHSAIVNDIDFVVWQQ
jgi:hypothetical protein